MPAVPVKKTPKPKTTTSKKPWPIITKRFGSKVRDAGVVPVPRVMITGLAELGMRPIHAIILLQLLACWGNNGPHPFPSRRRLCKWIGCDKRTLDRAISELVDLELVKKNKRTRERFRQTSNEYDLAGLIEKLQPIAKQAIVERARIAARRAAEAAF